MEESELIMELDESDDVGSRIDQDESAQTAGLGDEVNPESDHPEPGNSRPENSRLHETETLDEEIETAADDEAELHQLEPEPSEEPSSSIDDSEAPNPAASYQPQAYTAPPSGIKFADSDGHLRIDALAGRSSIFGLEGSGLGAFGLLDPNNKCTDSIALLQAIASAGKHSSASSLSDLPDLINQMINPGAVFTAGKVDIHSDVDLARESAFWVTRTRDAGKRYKTIVVSGSNHGNTLAGHTASSHSPRRDQCGPLIAGFAHVAADIDSIRKSIDDQTSAVLFSPWGSDGASGEFEASFLTALRDTCDENDLLLIADESDLVFGSTGSVLATLSVSNIDIDLAILSAGLFGGLPGGCLVHSRQFVETCREETKESVFAPNPINQLVSRSFLNRILEEQVLASAEQRASDIARQIAQSIAGFDFVRDISQLGASISIETDIDSTELVRNAARVGLEVEPAGPTGIQMRLPIMVDVDDLELLVKRIAQSFEVTEYQTAQALNH